MNPEFKLEDWLDKEGGMNIKPTPELTLKMWTVHGEKVFINITSHHCIDAPEEKFLVDYE